MRLFLGLPLQADIQAELDHWRSVSLPAFSRPVDAANFHLTLAFLGEVNNAQLRSVVDLSEGVIASPFTFRLDELGYWPKQEICYLAPKDVPEPLIELAESTRQVARRSGLRTEKRRYRPHLTMARRCQSPPPAPLIEPAFDIPCTEFCLFESHRTRKGVRYEILQSFDL